MPRTLGDFCGYGLLREHPPISGVLLGQESSPDVFHVTSPLWPTIPLHRLIPSPFLRTGARLVVTLYDLIPLIFEDQYLSDPWYRQWFASRLKLIQEADHVLALSRTTRDDAVRLLGLDPKRITVIYGGVSKDFQQTDEPQELVRTRVMSRLPEIRGPYILYPAGTAQYRKNISAAIEAYARLPQLLRETMQLVVIGYFPEPQRKVLEEQARKHGVEARLVLPGFVTEELLRELYQACDLCIYPSLYEGLGFPILEAMRCGAPVVTSDRSSTKELVEIPEARFDPEDPSEMAHVIRRAITNEDLRQELIQYGLNRARQFTWERVAGATADCYREVGASMVQRRSWRAQQPVSRPIDAVSRSDRSSGWNRNKMCPRERKPRVHLSLRALQSPAWLHHRGWIRYVYDHAQQLLRDHRDLITGLHIDGDLPLPKGMADFCGYGLLQESTLARQRPLEDDKIPDIFHVMSPISPEGADRLRQVLPPEFRRASTRIVVTLYDLIPLLFEDQYLRDPRYRAWYLGRLRLIQEADHVLAISKATASDAIRLLGISPERVTVIYTGIRDSFRSPDVPTAQVRKDVIRRVPQITGPYILSMMYDYEIDRRKNMEGIVEGYARLPQEVRSNFQLVFVGHGLEPDIRGLVRYARRNGMEDRLVLPGLVSDEVLRELYQGCDLFVFASRYEGLGLPVLEAMRCGAPVIISDRPAMNELIEIDEAQFNPEDSADIARVMLRVLTDAEFQRRLREYGLQRSKGFTWERLAQATADCYREVA